jgi:phage protein D/phage baseplate assembly protein gpV
VPDQSIQSTSPDVTVGGRLLPAAWYEALQFMRIHRELCLVGRATLRFSDPGYELAQASIFGLGDPVEILLQGEQPIFSGTVVGAALEQTQGNPPELVITVDDKAYRLGMQHRIKPHLHMSIPDIISSLASEAALTASVSVAFIDVYDHLLQRSTDLDFLDMLTRRANAMWWVDDTKLNVRTAGTSEGECALDGMNELRDFSVRANGLQPADVTVKGWDDKQKQNVVGTTSSVSSSTKSNFVDGFLGSEPAGKLHAASNVNVLSAANPRVQNEAEVVATSWLTSWHAAGAVARGTVIPGTAQIKPATKLTVSNVGPMSGTYVVSSVEHVYSTKGLVTKFVAGPVRPAGLVDTLGASRVDDGLTMANLTTGLVTASNDPEGMGRVKVKFAGIGDDVESDWARVLSLGAGASRGAVFQPEINDEVLVGFERGDTRRPVVLGGLYSKPDTFAADKSIDDNGKVAYRRVTSRLGHVLELGDGAGPDKQHILLKLGTIGHTLRLGADAMTIDLEQGKPFTLKAGNAKIAIDAQGNIAIEGVKITLKATQDVEVQGLNVTTKAQVKAATSGAQVEIKAQAQAELSAGGPTAIKGAVVQIN